MSRRKALFASLLVVVDKAISEGREFLDALDDAITRAAKNERTYESALLRAVRDRYEEKTDSGEFLAIMAFLIKAQLSRAWREGMREAGYYDEMTADMESELVAYEIEEEGHARRLLNDILAAILAGLGWQSFQYRMSLWANRYEEVRNRAVIVAGKKKGILLRWDLGATERHCTTCATYAGQIKTAQKWDEIWLTLRHAPQSRELECKGYNCDCQLNKVRDVVQN